MLANAYVVVQDRGMSWSFCYVEKCWRVTDSVVGFFVVVQILVYLQTYSEFLFLRQYQGLVLIEYLTSLYFYLPLTWHISNNVAVELCWNSGRNQGRK